MYKEQIMERFSYKPVTKLTKIKQTISNTTVCTIYLTIISLLSYIVCTKNLQTSPYNFLNFHVFILLSRRKETTFGRYIYNRIIYNFYILLYNLISPA